MIVKVCGVRTADVAVAAIDAGADWLGLVLETASPRQVDDAAAREVMLAARGRAELVGVMVSPSVAACEEAAARYRLSAIQAHGEVDASLAERSPVPVIRGINPRTAVEALTLGWWPRCMVLLDAAPAEDGELPGGTGRQVDRTVAAAVARHRPVLLAGGLDGDNVGEAIEAVHPRGVDASTRLESAPGVKDVGRVEAYVRAARRAFDRASDGGSRHAPGPSSLS